MCTFTFKIDSSDILKSKKYCIYIKQLQKQYNQYNIVLKMKLRLELNMG